MADGKKNKINPFQIFQKLNYNHLNLSDVNRTQTNFRDKICILAGSNASNTNYFITFLQTADMALTFSK